MIYEMRPPAAALKNIVKSYWLIDSEGNGEIIQQKIVPDGYPEIIMHYGDAYEINLSGTWKRQETFLLAGQLKKHFYLRNTGVSGMLGIKFQPTALSYLFGIDMSEITDRVIPLPLTIKDLFKEMTLKAGLDADSLFKSLDAISTKYLGEHAIEVNEIDEAVREIIRLKGNLDMATLCDHVACSQRKLERQFKSYVGLSPKFYARVIRLSHIFELMQQGDQSWSDLVYHSGFYDQSHFIKNFKEFTGEDPSAYGFEEENMANFHLRK